MNATNLGEADGLSTIEWSTVEAQLADLLMHDDPRLPNRATFWLTTLNADGSPHVTSVGVCRGTPARAGSRPAGAHARRGTSRAYRAARSALPRRDST